MPISGDSTSVTAGACGGAIRPSASAVIQPAVPPPTITTRLGACPFIDLSAVGTGWKPAFPSRHAASEGDAHRGGVATVADEPGAAHQADRLLHQHAVGGVGQVLGFDPERDLVVQELEEDRAVELAV